MLKGWWQGARLSKVKLWRRSGMYSSKFVQIKPIGTKSSKQLLSMVELRSWFVLQPQDLNTLQSSNYELLWKVKREAICLTACFKLCRGTRKLSGLIHSSTAERTTRNRTKLLLSKLRPSSGLHPSTTNTIVLSNMFRKSTEQLNGSKCLNVCKIVRIWSWF